MTKLQLLDVICFRYVAMLVTMPLSAGPRHLLTTTHARNCRYFSLTGIFRLFTCSRHTCLVRWPGRRFYAHGNFVRGGKLVFLDEGNYSLRAGPNWSSEEEVLCNRFPAPVNHHRQSIALLYNESQKIWSIMGATNTISHWEELVSQLMTIIGFPNDFPNVVETIIFP